jgi:hypothetical protein
VTTGDKRVLTDIIVVRYFSPGSVIKYIAAECSSSLGMKLFLRMNLRYSFWTSDCIWVR